MKSKKAKELLKMIEDINFYLTLARVGNIEHRHAYEKAFNLEKKLVGYRNAFYGIGNPSWNEVIVPLNEIEINILIKLVKESGVLNDK